MVNAAKKKNEGYSQSKYYLGFLVCRGAPRALGEGSTVHLPVLLCCGTVRTTKAVHFLLQKFFDCSISAIKLSQEDLAWLCALQADEKGTSKETSQVEMVFTFPHLSVKNTIQFKIPLQSLKYLWERYVCMSVFMCVCVCVCVRARACVCMYMYVCIHAQCKVHFAFGLPEKKALIEQQNQICLSPEGIFTYISKHSILFLSSLCCFLKCKLSCHSSSLSVMP